jgi:hypothetical protein
MKKATRSEKQGSQSQGENISKLTPGELLEKAPSKLARVLVYVRHVDQLNRFEAERIGDHCLNSTISALANDHGLAFERTPEKVPNNWGRPCDVIRYGLPESQHAQADQALALMFSRSQKAPEVSA